MLKHTQTILWQKRTNCLSVFDDFVWLPLKGLSAFPKNSILEGPKNASAYLPILGFSRYKTLLLFASIKAL